MLNISIYRRSKIISDGGHYFVSKAKNFLRRGGVALFRDL